MRIYELRYPGSFLDIQDLPAWRDVTGLLVNVEMHLAAAALGVALFEQEYPKIPIEPGAIRRREAAGVAFDRMRAAAPGGSVAEWRALQEAADLEIRRQEWASGRLPDLYARSLPLLYAHAVVYALDGVAKSLGKLKDVDDLAQAARDGVAAAHVGLQAALPDLTKVRDSAHHGEDRARGKTYNRVITPQHVVNEAMDSYGFFMASLVGTRLGYTADDGHYAEVDISSTSVEAAQAAIQQAIEALPWTGDPRTAPD